MPQFVYVVTKQGVFGGRQVVDVFADRDDANTAADKVDIGHVSMREVIPAGNDKLMADRAMEAARIEAETLR